MAGAEPSICYYSKENRQTVSTELGQSHKPDIKALCKHWCCCTNLLQLSWYKIEDMGHLGAARIGNACPAPLPCSPSLYQCLVHPGDEESQHKAAGNAASFARRAAHTQGSFTGGCQDRKLHLGILSRRWERGIA